MGAAINSAWAQGSWGPTPWEFGALDFLPGLSPALQQGKEQNPRPLSLCPLRASPLLPGMPLRRAGRGWGAGERCRGKGSAAAIS